MALDRIAVKPQDLEADPMVFDLWFTGRDGTGTPFLIVDTDVDLEDVATEVVNVCDAHYVDFGLPNPA